MGEVTSVDFPLFDWFSGDHIRHSRVGQLVVCVCACVCMRVCVCILYQKYNYIAQLIGTPPGSNYTVWSGSL